ncbi:MAG: protein kinase [Rubrivivax sp.]|nr:protein kinase [Rubrivivax sp.]
MSLSATDLRSLSRLLDTGLALDAPARAAWLSGLAGADLPLAPRLRELLAVPLSDDGPLAALPSLPDPGPAAQPGEVVGPYRLLREIGRGGMGEVWLAERADGAFERQVALKLPRQAVAGALAERLRREVQLVARLEHPHIARLYDTGTDARGHPYIAMEYVDGVAIDRHVRGLSLAPRLRLFGRVLGAVAYAHGRLVLHLDLKPANVLVSADGAPHLLDFGIAALLGPNADPAEGAITDPAPQRALTPRYASPEQVAGEALGVQADVFALGVMLGELLSDQPPCPELAAIVAMARAPDPGLRYASVEALAADLERFLRHEPVNALRQGLLARAAKALRRHWVGAGVAAGVLGVLLGGAALYALHLQRMAQAAERERVVKSFVAELFTLGAPSLGDAGTQAPAGRWLDDSARLIQNRFAGQPALQAELFGLVGAGYVAMGAGSLAVELLGQQVETLKAMGAADAPRAQAMLDLAEAQIERRQPQQAQPLLDQMPSLAGATDAQRARAAVLAARMASDLGRSGDAEGFLAAWDAQAVPADADPALSAWADAVRAELLLRDGRLAEALPLLDAAATRAQAAQGPHSLVAAAIRFKAARWAVQARRNAEAQQRFEQGREALLARGGLHAVRAAVETAAFWDLLSGWSGLAPMDEKIIELQRSLVRVRALGDALPSLLVAEMEASIGSVHLNWGDVRGAAALIEPGLALRLKAIRVPLERTSLLGQAAGVAMDSGRHELADERYRARRAARVEAGRERHFLVANDARWIALNASMAGWTDAALQVLDEAPPAAQISVPGPDPQWYGDTLAEARARVLLNAGRAEAALALLRARAPRLQDSTLAGLPTAPDALRGEALCLGAGAADGHAALRRVHAGLDAVPHHPHAPQVARLRAVLGLCALRLGLREEAGALSGQARAAFAAEPAVSPYYKVPWIALERALQQR